MSDLATVTRVHARGMITLRGDFATATFKKAVKAVTGQALPAVGQMSGKGAGAALWMSPDEVLMMVPYGDVDDTVAALNKALAGTHHLVADVSDARAVFSISGVNARDVIGRLSPADLSDVALPIGTVRRTRLAQVPAAFFRKDADTFELVCFRSVADYAHGILMRAATAGSVTGFYA